MIFSRRRFIGAVAAGSAGLVAPRAFAAVRSGDRPALLPRAMAALDTHAFHIRNRDLMGLVDFTEPSALPRFHVVDIGNGRVLATHLVAHGRGSDPGNTGWLDRFSNRPGSNASCRGSFLTAGTYYGKHGRSGRLNGLDPENSNAASRAIVIHAADYVSLGMALLQGRIGRSLGCFAVPDRNVAEVLQQLGEGRLLFAWK
ncbi:L,D-transpeptidase catalytic domain [Novosphingobium sp. CF614]|uniref:murein L,D-transpeptidase catalytic domain family protein n=1 Tax=Novosphingobium sp. CF614 TaxID=1884364 RepID=UPI0008EAB2E7|nr:murein L,D-transpeptidase catalytic domain family protein [Novosphingobium sp. CF614]SFG27014.1 L,D-transpeptidase catalytic domain [Novosphingobium sp. CF614]